jgi:hypothetical protein
MLMSRPKLVKIAMVSSAQNVFNKFARTKRTGLVISRHKSGFWNVETECTISVSRGDVVHQRNKGRFGPLSKSLQGETRCTPVITCGILRVLGICVAKRAQLLLVLILEIGCVIVYPMVLNTKLYVASVQTTSTRTNLENC